MTISERLATNQQFRERLFLAGALGLSAGAGVALLVSQYLPMFGGLIANIAQPFSMARIYTILPHAFVFMPLTSAVSIGLTIVLGPKE